MKTFVLASQKGGSSKSMLCRCLAVAAEKAGAGPVAMIDTDPQATVAKWYNRRQTMTAHQTPILLQVSSIKGELSAALDAAKEAGIAQMFIDTQGAITEVIPEVGQHADYIIVPVRASPDDLDAMPATLNIVKQLGKPFCFVLTQVKSQALITGAAKLNVAQLGILAPVIMADRVDYPGAVIDGQTVLETEPNGRSAAEMMELWEYLSEQTRPATQRKARAA